jgi:hypothetical protein
MNTLLSNRGIGGKEIEVREIGIRETEGKGTF